MMKNETSLLNSAVSFIELSKHGNSHTTSLHTTSQHGPSKKNTTQNENQDAAIPLIKPLLNYLKQKEIKNNGRVESSNPSKNDTVLSSEPIVEQLLSKEDVAGILLPYAVKKLIYSSKQYSQKIPVATEIDEIIWETFSMSIQTLMKFDDLPSHLEMNDVKGTDTQVNVSNKQSNTLINSYLSQSTLQKLIPYTARVAFAAIYTDDAKFNEDQNQTTVDSNNETHYNSKKSIKRIKYLCAKAAATSFVCMMQIFRPSMDTSCTIIRDVMHLAQRATSENTKNNIVPTSPTIQGQIASETKENEGDNNNDQIKETEKAIAKDASSSILISIPFEFQRRIISSTLELFLKLLQQNAASPKKIFLLVTNDYMLPILSKISRIEVLSPFSNQNLPSQPDLTTQNLSVQNYNLNQLIRNILWDTLFHPLHHMEGFISACFIEDNTDPVSEETETKKIKKKRKTTVESSTNLDDGSGKQGKKIRRSCYQQLLFEMMQRYFSSDSSQNFATEIGNNKQKSLEEATDLELNNVLAAAYIIPLLFEGFIEQSNSWATKNAGDFTSALETLVGDKRKNPLLENSAHLSIVKTQFRFWRTIIKPLLDYLSFYSKNGTIHQDKYKIMMETCLLRTVSSTLKLLLQHDIYLPAYEDIGDVHIKSLHDFTRQIVERTESKLKSISTLEKNQQAYSSSIHILKQCHVELRIFQSLLRLNHHLFHEKLDRLLYIACKYLSVEYVYSLHNSDQNPQGERCKEASELIRLIVETYSKLRQINHLFSSFLTCPDLEMCEHNSFLEFIFRDASSVKALSTAIQNCPSGQVEDLWNIFETSILSMASPVPVMLNSKVHIAHNDARIRVGLKWKINMLILFIRSIHINKQSAVNIRSLCERSMETMIPKFLDGITPSHLDGSQTHSNILQLKLGLQLSGWLIDLHTRCCFWLEQLDVNDIDECSFLVTKRSNLLTLLHQVAEMAVKKSPFDKNVPLHILSTTQQFQHLSCHRIQQLHSMIHIQQHFEAKKITHGDKEKSQKMITEARLLTNLAFFPACGYRDTKESKYNDQDKETTCVSRWQILAESVSIWGFYCEEAHAISFLQWFFSVLSMTYKTKEANFIFFPSRRTLSQDVFNIEKNIILSLMQDASFFEAKQVVQNYGRVCLGCIVELLQYYHYDEVIKSGVLSSTSSKSKSSIYKTLNGRDFVVSPLNSNWKPLNSKEYKSLGVLLQNGLHNNLNNISDSFIASGKSMKRIRLLEQVLQLLRSLHGVPHDVVSQLDEMIIVDVCVRIDVFISRILTTDSSISNEVVQMYMKILCSCRNLFAVATSIHIEQIYEDLCPDTISMLNVTKYYIDSMVMLLNQLNRDTDFESIYPFILSTARAFEEIALLCIKSKVHHPDSSSIFYDVLPKFESKSVYSKSHSNIELATVVIARSVIRRIVLYSKDEHQIENNGCKDETVEGLSIARKTTRSALNAYLKLTATYAQNREHFFKDETTLFPNIILLLGEALHCWAQMQTSSDQETDKTFEKDIQTCTESLFLSIADAVIEENITLPNHMEKACFYFLSSVSAQVSVFFRFLTPDNVFSRMTHIVRKYYESNNEKEGSLLDSAYCGLVNQGNTAHIGEVGLNFEREVGLIFSKHPVSSGSLIHVFYLVSLSVKEDEKINHVARLANRFVLLALEVLQASDLGEFRKKITSTSLSFLKLIIEKREIIQLKSCNIAMILSQLSFKLGREKYESIDDCIQFSHFNTMLISLLKNYPKQVYTCVPNFVSILHHMLVHILKPSTHPKTIIISRQIKEFSKVCELMGNHKDVFKKHVVGLLLYFTDSLSSGITASTKKGLTPAIYFLLDVCSSFEMDQLNSLMGNTNKTLFRALYQNYQRSHCYKGQF